MRQVKLADGYQTVWIYSDEASFDPLPALRRKVSPSL